MPCTLVAERLWDRVLAPLLPVRLGQSIADYPAGVVMRAWPQPTTFIPVPSAAPCLLMTIGVPALQRLENYNPADVALSLCRMISYNIGQLAYLNAKRWDAPSRRNLCKSGGRRKPVFAYLP